MSRRTVSSLNSGSSDCGGLSAEDCGVPASHLEAARFTVNFDPDDPDAGCQLVVFRARGIAKFEESLVGDTTARGWLLTFEPQLPSVSRATVITTGVEIQGSSLEDVVFSESPPSELRFRFMALETLPSGLVKPTLLFWVQDMTTGLPIDPCCGGIWRNVYHFARTAAGLDVLFAEDPLTSPCTPDPEAEALGAGSGPAASGGKGKSGRFLRDW